MDGKVRDEKENKETAREDREREKKNETGAKEIKGFTGGVGW